MKTETLSARAILVAGAILAAGSFTGPARAQEAAEPAAAAEDTSGDIIVTAQRRAERLQDVPIAITALGGEELDRKGAKDITNLVGAVPGLRVNQSAGVNSQAVFTIRGIGPGAGLSAIGSNAPTAIYIDGIYMPKVDSGLFALADVERVEVLRGPQGTLYGRNATAGAINIVTRDPGPDFTGSFEASYGNFDTIRVKGYVSVPLAEGLSASVSGAYDRHDGYQFNTVTGNRLLGDKKQTVRAKLGLDRGPVKLVLSADYSNNLQGTYYKETGQGIGVVDYGDPRFVTTYNEDLIFSRAKSGGIGATANIEASDDLALTLVGSYRTLKSLVGAEVTTGVPNAIFANGINESDSIFFEARGVLDKGRFRMTAGANYLIEDGHFAVSIGTREQTYINNPTPVDDATNKAAAVYGQAEFDVTDWATIVGGLRLNYENRDFQSDYRFAQLPGIITSGKVRDTHLLKMAGVNFKPTRDILVFAKYSEGYLAPGFNFLPGRTATENLPFLAEYLDSYEAGIKSQWFDRVLTFNATYFHYDYQDLQVRINTGPAQVAVRNAANAKVDGFDLELRVAPVPAFSVAVNYNYTDARYSNYCEPLSASVLQLSDPLCAPGQADRSGNRLPFGPKSTLGISADFDQPISDKVVLRANAQLNREGKSFFTAGNDPELSAGPYTQIDARIGLLIDERFEVFAYGTNLRNKRDINTSLRTSPTSIVSILSNPPRLYGIGGRFTF